MKKLILVALLGWSCSSFAWFSTQQEPGKTYTFQFEYAGERLEVRRPAHSFEDAYEHAAEVCFKHYKELKQNLTEDDGLDIIDVCANPRS